MLRAAGVPVVASTNGRSGNLWATDESLAALEAKAGAHVIELTSSHLAFMATSPQIAVVTSFWPDHLELHGSLAAYRAAKENIVKHQRPGDRVIVASAPEVASYADATPGDRWLLSPEGERGAFIRDGRIVARDGVDEVELGPAPAGVRAIAVLSAVAAVAAYGVPLDALVGEIEGLEQLPLRACRVGSLGATALIDDSMAATPAKTVAALQQFGPAAVTLVAGGLLEAAGIPVHTSTEERALLDEAFARIARGARLVVAFGPAGDRVATGVRACGGRVEQVGSLAEAIARALVVGSDAEAILVSPMFPVSPEDRARVEGLLLGSAG